MEAIIFKIICSRNYLRVLNDGGPIKRHINQIRSSFAENTDINFEKDGSKNIDTTSPVRNNVLDMATSMIVIQNKHNRKYDLV